ncbi:MFS transporter [Oleiagrimonas citrea]|jgi:MFS transporter, DHA1 family, inner membrane transport protein|uniref:MFS transporter n=1 Tax=Oleiagrimonas citrea TaxID=1665687 RepID=A0A846ZKS5_9GAMM|nr:MFS transporter [Oleiagrimonas citrea]NKZ38392.1 MFS transporter [Oleiagrimonas citrea]
MTRHTASPSTSAGSSLAVIIFWLASGAFAIGAGEFAAMSLLPYFAAEFHASEAVAGHAISAYALGVVIGAPLIAMFASRLPRKHVLLALMGVFAIGNLLTALAPSMWTMDLARFLSGLPHGAFFGIAMLFAADIAGKHRRAQAVSQVILGLAIANIVGVPVVNYLGQLLGWRTGFAMVAALACLTVIMVWRTAPYKGPHPDAHPLAEIGAFRNRDVLLTLAMGAIGFGGMFAVYTYFSAAFLATTHAPAWGVSVILMIYGVGTTLGNIVAGAFSGGRLLKAALALQIVLGLACGFYAFSIGNVVLMGTSLFIIGLGGGLVVPLQTRLMDVAGNAQTLAAAMNHAAFNMANALGPWLAGMALTAGWGWRATGGVGVALALGGVAIWLAMRWSESRRTLDADLERAPA